MHSRSYYRAIKLCRNFSTRLRDLLNFDTQRRNNDVPKMIRPDINMTLYSTCKYSGSISIALDKVWIASSYSLFFKRQNPRAVHASLFLGFTLSSFSNAAIAGPMFLTQQHQISVLSFFKNVSLLVSEIV